MANENGGDMITRRTMPWSIYAVLLVAIEILGFYASACFLYDDVSIQNFSEYMIRGCTENWFLPWRIANRMTPECMGIALMGWIFLVSYMMYHFRNWQGGMEHGAEDWADAFDVAKRRANPDDTKNRVLSANVRIDTQGDRKLSNNNMIVIGSSGTYKTTSVVTPNLLQANENYIILDVKGELLYKYGLFLKSRGYTIRVLNLKEQDKSDGYNPFDYIENELDLIKLIANIQAACNPPDAMTSDPFWKEGAGLYLQAVFYYEWFMARREGRPGTFNNVLTLLNEETRPDTNVKPVKGQPQQTVLQSVAQIKTLFSGDKWQTIMDNCVSACLASPVKQKHAVTEGGSPRRIESSQRVRSAAACNSRNCKQVLAVVAALFCWRLFLLFLGAGAGAMDTHKYISDLLGNMTIDTTSDTARGLAVDESHQKSGAPLMTPQQVKRMKRKYCIILMEEERPIRYKVTPPPFGRRQVGRRN